MTNKQRNLTVSGANLTDVWLRALEHLLEPGVEQLTHFTVRLLDFEDGFPDEYSSARDLLDEVLGRRGPCTTNANANLLFPESAWKIQRHRGVSAQAFLKSYHDDLMPRLAKQDKRNHAGTYFDRMVAYPNGSGYKNQLAELLELWQRRVRRQSAYQVSIYQPAEDLTAVPIAIYQPYEDLDASPFMAFPCLDHIAFTREKDDLLVSAFYAYQFIFDRGYGNYLGLCRLGRFMAEQMGLRFAQLSCHVAAAKTGMGSKDKERLGKAELKELVARMRAAAANDSGKKAA
jgi:hypothetical protein